MSTDIIDSLGIPDTFCTGLVRIERLGPCRRLVLCTATARYSGATERQPFRLDHFAAQLRRQVRLIACSSVAPLP